MTDGVAKIDPPEKEIIIDDHHRARYLRGSGQVIGMVLFHDRPVGGLIEYETCTPGMILWEPYGDSRPLYTLDPNEEEITLTPFIVCSECNEKGWIRQGKWVDFSHA